MYDINKCFEILNILPDTPYEEARAAYRELASILHPDKHMHNERLRVRAADKFKQLLNAWNELEVYYKVGASEHLKQKEYENKARGRRDRERADRERQDRERQDRERADRERADRERAEAILRAKEERKASQGKCPTCGIPYEIPVGKLVENYKCGACNKSLCQKLAMEELAEQERRERNEKLRLERQRTNKENFNTALIIYAIVYLVIIVGLGGWGLGITIMTAPFLVVFTNLMCCGWTGSGIE
jgi:curved DNA-binding protein CbpA